MEVQKLGFVCEGNAGRSQLATALAEHQAKERKLDIDIVTGGVDPSDQVHQEVIDVLAEQGIDIGDRIPRKIQSEDIADADYVVTMGCSVDQFQPTGWNGTSERWELEHPSAGDVESARDQRDEIQKRVDDLFDSFTN